MTQTTVKLTKYGATSLKAWLDSQGATFVELGEMLGTNSMAARRLITREGRLSLEQVGKIAAYSDGDLTAETLVGPLLAGRVPAQKIPRAVEVEKLTPLAPRPRVAKNKNGEKMDVEELAKEYDAENIEVLRYFRDTAKNQNLRVRCALALNEIANGRPGQRERQEKKEYPVRDEELIEKFRRLLEDARARHKKEHPEMEINEIEWSSQFPDSGSHNSSWGRSIS